MQTARQTFSSHKSLASTAKVLSFSAKVGENVYIVSNDADFFFYEGVQYVPWGGLTVDKDRAQVEFEFFTLESVAATLQLDATQICDAAILAGTDQSKTFLEKYSVLTELGVVTRNEEWTQLPEIFTFVKSRSPIQALPKVKAWCSKDTGTRKKREGVQGSQCST